MDKQQRSAREAFERSRSQNRTREQELQSRKQELDRATVRHAEAKKAKEQSNRIEVVQSSPRPRPQRGELGKMANEVDRQVAAEKQSARARREQEAYQKAQQAAQRQGIEKTRDRGMGR
ncbi:hypothetical protein [Parvularcula marina]|uniref:hypothetical protein n=1 Tax=Parvularcula marina TaxID=2292771 RepID=UPI0035141301